MNYNMNHQTEGKKERTEGIGCAVRHTTNERKGKGKAKDHLCREANRWLKDKGTEGKSDALYLCFSTSLSFLLVIYI